AASPISQAARGRSQSPQSNARGFGHGRRVGRLLLLELVGKIVGEEEVEGTGSPQVNVTRSIQGPDKINAIPSLDIAAAGKQGSENVVGAAEVKTAEGLNENVGGISSAEDEVDTVPRFKITNDVDCDRSAAQVEME